MPPGKKSGKALMREEGLERTDNNLPSHSWPVVGMINQKNYYTEYLKRDDQILVLREAAEASLREAAAAAAEKPREADDTAEPMNIDGDEAKEEGAQEEETERYGSKIIVIHPGSQNLRIGFASDALPKSVPNVIAKKAEKAECEIEERWPKRVKVEGAEEKAKDGTENEDELPPVELDEEFDAKAQQMAGELRQKMKSNKRRMLPNSAELVRTFNRRSVPEMISEHNDPYRVEWTDVAANAKEFYVGDEALRIPDHSNPRYRLFWPLRYGWFNERDYTSKRRLLEDVQTIIEEAIRSELKLEPRQLKDYKAVLVVPDLYERNYVTDMVHMLMKEICFSELCIIQESLAATFGAGFSQACIVDIGAQKTSVCCVEEGMVVAESRTNIKYGGQDVTDAFMRLLFRSAFPYSSFNIWRRYDYLLAEELKHRLVSLHDGDVGVAPHEFHLRRPDKDTRKYQFRVNDELYIAPMSHFRPDLLPHQHKLDGRRSLWERSYDIYDNTPNDPLSSAQTELLQSINPPKIEAPPPPPPAGANGTAPDGTPLRPSFAAHLDPGKDVPTPRSSAAGSPAPDGTATPLPDAPASTTTTTPALSPLTLSLRMWESYDATVPIAPLDELIVSSISHAAKGDEKKMRDFFGSIMVVGGGGSVKGLNHLLEERLRANPKGREFQVVIANPPRELDVKVIVWKGASVFGKLRGTNDSWIGRREYDMLGVRLLTHKCMWGF